MSFERETQLDECQVSILAVAGSNPVTLCDFALLGSVAAHLFCKQEASVRIRERALTRRSIMQESNDPKNVEEMNKDERHVSKFREHLEENRKIISTWPDWERNILGRTQIDQRTKN